MLKRIPAFVILALLPAVAPSAPPEPNEAALLANLKWRSIGPANMGGRVTDIAGIPGDPSIFYVGAADGGIFKTTNGGTTFDALFQDQPVLSIGAIAIAPSDPNVIWAGTGEGDPRNSASFGNGVYRSTDAGKTWKHLGLADSERIKRIRVDPRDPDTAYVATLGHAWGPNEERGVFKTTDAGKTWTKVLYVDRDTGCADIDMDPQNPRILYAGMYTYRRKPWRFDSGGGATALYRTSDSGATWQKLAGGLPRSAMDRIGVAIARSQPATVYMITETKSEGVLFRSDDRGETWRSVNSDPNINFRPFYYSDIRVDPNDPECVYSLSGGLYMSRDGGRTFRRIAGSVHGDHQALWIDPQNSNRILSGSDGGFQVSYDKAQTFEIINNVAISQYYHVFYDLRQPYYVYGGLQDNGNWAGPSATLFREGIRKDDWYSVGGGDGFSVVPDLSSPNIVYADSQGGNILVMDTATGMSRSIHPYPKEVGSSGNAVAGYKYRFNWNAPIALSSHDSKTVYFGGNVVFRTTNRGQSWDEISPDLTTNDKSKQQTSGGPVVTDNTAAEFHCTILTIAESPVARGVIWVGTDDGNIQVTRDGGKSWSNVTGNVAGLAAHSWIPTIDASHFEAGTAYVAADRHRDDDFGPYAFKTADYGKTWTAIRGNLPAKGYVHVVREDPKNRNLLYAGTELGVFASWDGGQRWVSIRNNLPPVAVNDLVVHPRDNDLILGTHGRGIWILDDIAPLQQLGDALTSDAHLFDVRPAFRYAIWSKDASLGQKTFAAPNPAYGAYVDYYLKTDTNQPVEITVTDRAGKTVRVIRGAANKAGVHRAVWDLRYDGPSGGQAGGPAGAGSGRFGGGRRGGPGLSAPAASPEAGAAAAPEGAAEGGFGRLGLAAPQVVPGEYTLTVSAAGKKLSKPVRVALDPRIKVSQQELQAQLSTALELRDVSTTVNSIVTRIEDLTRQLTQLADTLRKAAPAAPSTGNGDGTNGSHAASAESPSADVDAALKELAKLRAELVREGSFSYRYPPKLREEVSSLLGSVSGPIAAPTEAQKLRLREVKDAAAKASTDLDAIVSGRIKRINERLSGQPHVVVAPARSERN
jgi:photosystem II stability/assembly factor-like uncharacterized protein